MADQTVLAVDMGGTKIAVGIVGHDGRVLVRTRTLTPTEPDAEVVWAALSDAIDALPDVERVGGVGVGCGGPMVWPAGRV